MCWTGGEGVRWRGEVVIAIVRHQHSMDTGFNDVCNKYIMVYVLSFSYKHKNDNYYYYYYYYY